MSGMSISPTQSKKILFIIWSLSYGGGAERILSYLVKGLNKTGKYEIEILEICRFDIGKADLPDGVKILNPVFDETRGSFPFAQVRKLAHFLFPRMPNIFRKIIRDNTHYDYVISFNYLLPTFLVNPTDKSIAWVHGSIENLKGNANLRFQQKNAFRHIDSIVTISDRTKESILELYPDYEKKLTKIYNGFPIDSIVEKSQEPLQIDFENNYVVFVGCLNEGKRPLLALEAFAQIRKLDKSLHLCYIGTGPLESSLIEQIQALQLEKYVHVLGYIDNPYPYIKNAKCILSFSEAEGFQSVFVEGLILGTPFISTPVGAAEEISENGKFGKVIYDLNEIPASFSDLVKRSSNKRFKEEMYNFAQKFSIEAQVQELENLLSVV